MASLGGSCLESVMQLQSVKCQQGLQSKGWAELGVQDVSHGWQLMLAIS